MEEDATPWTSSPYMKMRYELLNSEVAASSSHIPISEGDVRRVQSLDAGPMSTMTLRSFVSRLPQGTTKILSLGMFSTFELRSILTLDATLVLGKTPALLVYDYLLTFPVEVQLVWRRKFSGVTVLFFFIRYCTLLGRVWYIALSIMAFTVSKKQGYRDEVMAIFMLMMTISGFLASISIWIFNILRIYTVWGKKWYVALPVGAIGLALACFGKVSATPLIITPNEIYSRDIKSSLILLPACEYPSDATGILKLIMLDWITSSLLVVASNWGDIDDGPHNNPNLPNAQGDDCKNHTSATAISFDVQEWALAAIGTFALSALEHTINSSTRNFYVLEYLIDTASAILITRFMLRVPGAGEHSASRMVALYELPAPLSRT
ncbi:hypothetical protein NLI96_g6763 [Meripilus lineatus]|uniref:DUF6533 domain-containing protein n=1 Tax=Meripilus lineatus TaxID=2056292 RepID=A0AAD5V2M6_9APHY|nr:hypothetical protein NLI96_g6763 [Physisporinus lineatus]